MKELKRKDEVYWEVNEEGETIGDPYCPRCYEADEEKQVHLITVNERFGTKKCPQCDLPITVKK